MYRTVFWTLWENGIEIHIISYMERVASPGLMHDTGCLGLVHWDDPEGWYGKNWCLFSWESLVSVPRTDALNPEICGCTFWTCAKALSLWLPVPGCHFHTSASLGKAPAEQLCQVVLLTSKLRNQSSITSPGPRFLKHLTKNTKTPQLPNQGPNPRE